MSSATPPGWYQDPEGHPQQRWWNGQQWTADVRPTPAATAPAASAPAAAAASAPKGGISSGMVFLFCAIALAVGAVAGYVMRGDGDSTTDSGSPTAGPGDDGSNDSGGGDGDGSGPNAVPILQGLASLNSYEWHLTVNYRGTGGESTAVEANGAADTQADTSYQKQSTTSVSTFEGETETSTSVNETWRVGDRTCTFTPDSDPAYDVETRNPFEFELGGSLPSVLDLVVVSENATFVADEQIAGVPAKHYSFTVEGLGTGSGSQVTANQGELWVAADGNYVLKYQVSTGLRTAPEGTPDAEAFEMSLLLELTSVNQPVTVTMPAECPAA